MSTRIPTATASIYWRDEQGPHCVSASTRTIDALEDILRAKGITPRRYGAC